MDRGQDGIRSGRQDRARFHDTFVRAFPPVPQSGEGEEPLVTHSDKERLFPALLPLPLIESVGGDEATMPAERIAEGRFFTGCFRTGVDEPIADRRILRPGRDEAPAEKGKLASASRGGGAYGGNGRDGAML